VNHKSIVCCNRYVIDLHSRVRERIVNIIIYRPIQIDVELT